MPQFFQPDGRRAERIINELDLGGGAVQTTTEIFVEPEVPKQLTSRITETVKPVVVGRTIETLGPGGEVVERKVEDIGAPACKVVEHVATGSASVQALAVSDCDCYVTQQEMQATFAEGFQRVVEALKGEPQTITMQSVVAEKIAAVKWWDVPWVSSVLYVSIAALAAFFVYVVVLM